MRLPEHKCGLYLEHNVHRDYYETIEKAVLDEDQNCGNSWVSPEEREKALLTGELWTLQWYPETPIGFHRLAASTLDTLLEAANAAPR